MVKRIGYIDKLKGFAIILVVMGHIAEKSLNIHNSSFNAFYESFHMPLFMFLSGLFAMKSFINWNCSEISLFVRKKTLRIILPFIVVGGFYSLLCYHDLSIFYPGNGGYWFLPALFYCMLTEMIVGGTLYRIKLGLIFDIVTHLMVFALLTAVYYGLQPDIPYYLAFFKLYLFFWFGVCCTKYPRLFEHICQSKWMMALSCLLYLGLIPFSHQTPVRLTGFFAIIICLQMFIAYDNQIPKVLSKIGQSSLAIYVFHWFLLPSQLSLGDMLSTPVGPLEELHNGNFVLIFLISLIIALPIAFVCVVIEKIIKQSKWLDTIIFGTQNK